MMSFFCGISNITKIKKDRYYGYYGIFLIDIMGYFLLILWDMNII